MREYIPYLIFGLTAGSIYGICAMGLVLTYKTSGLFNLAHGAVCAAAAYVFYDLRQNAGLPWPVAALLSVLVFGAVVGLLLERMAGALAEVTTTYKIVATIGLLVAVRSLIVLRYGPTALFFEPVFPQRNAFTIDSVQVTYDNLIDMAIGVAAAIGLYVLFRATRLGTAMRGVVDDPLLLDMTGTDPVRVRRAAWVIGSCFAAVSGVLFASVQTQLDVNVLSLLVVQAFGAAAIGRFTSLPIAFVGGVVIGVVQQIVSKEISGHQNLQGLDINLPFFVLFAVLVFTSRGKLVEVGRAIKMRAVPPSPFSPRTRVTGYAALLGASLLVPHVVGSKLIFYDTALTQAILFLSLALLVRTSGQISLCHVGFAAIGACGFGHMLQDGVPWALAVILGGLIVVPIGAIIAIPAIRLSGLYLGLATLGFGILVANFAYNKEYMFGLDQIRARRPDGFSNDTKYYYLLLGIFLACLALVLVVERSRLGRILRGMGDSPVALTTMGTNINVSRILVFCISAFLAGVSGATYASLFGAVSGDSFSYFNSLIILAILAISGRRTVSTVVVAALLYNVIPGYITDPDLQQLLYVFFGLAAIGVAALSQGQASKWASRYGTNAAERLAGPASDRVRLQKAAAVHARPTEMAGVGSPS